MGTCRAGGGAEPSVQWLARDEPEKLVGPVGVEPTTSRLWVGR